MGGHALKTVKCTRKSRSEYTAIKEHVWSVLSAHLALATIPELPDKEDFGDLDLLYTPTAGLCVRDLVETLFAPQEIVTNGGITSFNVGDFQIDLIRCTNIPFAQFFFGYGDFGGLLGIMTSVHGLKFGHDALWIRLSVEDQYNKLILTEDPVAACEFLGISYSQWQSVASTKDVFDMLTSCNVFHPSIFHAEKPQKGRPMRIAFAEHIAGIDSGKGCKESLVDVAIRHFGREEDLEKIRAKVREHKERAAKLNGRMLLEAGVPPQDIGKVLQGFRDSITIEWLDRSTSEEVHRALMEYIARDGT